MKLHVWLLAKKTGPATHISNKVEAFFGCPCNRIIVRQLRVLQLGQLIIFLILRF